VNRPDRKGIVTKRFPILLNERERREWPDCPTSVPWALVAGCEDRAFKNHGQDLATLARRGGLHPLELQAVLEDRAWGYLGLHSEAMRNAIDFIRDQLTTVDDTPA
jgi:hypothetical protein